MAALGSGSGGLWPKEPTRSVDPPPLSMKKGRGSSLVGRLLHRPVRAVVASCPWGSWALRAGVPVFAVSRFIGSSIAMIDRHYGHLARDSHVHAVSLLDALTVDRAVDTTWTANRTRATALSNSDSKSYRRRTHRRVDAR